MIILFYKEEFLDSTRIGVDDVVNSPIKITIGLCVKNAESTIRETVDSILVQSFPHSLIELIVVDGHSKDRTVDIIKESFSETSVRPKLFFENEGIGFARQLVVDNASGDYILWVDGDITLSKDYIEKLVEFMEQNPNVGIAKGKYMLSFKGNLLSSMEEIGRKLKYLDLKYEGEAHRSKTMATEGSIYRVNAIRQAGGFDKKIRKAGEDMDAEYRIKNGSWTLYITNAFFSSSENDVSWKNLWNKYFQFGYNLHYVLHKHKDIVRLPTMLPPAAFLSGLLRSEPIFQLTRRKISFLLPVYSTLTSIVWCLGFTEGHINSYEPEPKRI